MCFNSFLFASPTKVFGRMQWVPLTPPFSLKSCDQQDGHFSAALPLWWVTACRWAAAQTVAPNSFPKLPCLPNSFDFANSSIVGKMINTNYSQTFNWGVKYVEYRSGTFTVQKASDLLLAPQFRSLCYRCSSTLCFFDSRNRSLSHFLS